MVSQETTIEFNESVVQGVKGYHNTVLKDVAVNKWKVVPPPKVLLDYNNIPKYEKALLTSYRESPDPQNPYFIMKNGSHAKYYTLMHDGIQKFSHELNGSYRRTVNIEDDIEVKNVPWALTEIPGRSMNTAKLMTNIVKQTSIVRPPKVRAKNEFCRLHSHMFPEADKPLLPDYLIVAK